MSIPFSTKMAALLTKAVPEQIYSYKPGKLITIGSYSLSLTFLLYGASFADWSLTTSTDLYKEEAEETKVDAKWYEHAKVAFLGRSAGSVILSIIPFTLAVIALYIPTRIVTKLHYIPEKIPKCKVTTRTLFNREKSTIIPLRNLRRHEKARVFTGVGDQGVEDRGSFSFSLMDNQASFFKKFYIVNRSGKFWGSDGRFMDALFGRESITQLELKSFKTQQSSYAKNEEKLEKMIQEQISRPRLNNNTDVKNIVLSSRNNHKQQEKK
ncbi:unnamed protein product [Kluyveromyces dobzhanskii CBS 2104]|uniref:WGS project CCBQ000000000 data, contig 00015 n=1 Tax=Kluyveromyces dobzhanskii CBS 2104 TaxID=1427455 RepID=A0A0A8LCB2_9SACH|nr:unnamed protein product [Kluyveromyces dobzhanskii CBS 2104]